MSGQTTIYKLNECLGGYSDLTPNDLEVCRQAAEAMIEEIKVYGRVVDGTDNIEIIGKPVN